MEDLSKGMEHPCELIYNFSDKPVYGETKGICRITGKYSKGILFEKWIGENFTDFGSLYPGDIISNEAIFCFSDENEFLRKKLGRTERTRFRNYSHFVVDGEWLVFTKSQKQEMYRILVERNPIIVVISDSGQRHLLFRYRYGFWQFEFQHIKPNKSRLQWLVGLINRLLDMGFSKSEILSSCYSAGKKIEDVKNLEKIESHISSFRGSKLFELAVWFSVKQNKESEYGED